MFFGRDDSRVKPPTYLPLKDDEIRLLVLEPGANRDALKASLKIVSLRTRPVYSAISYAWGPANFTQRIHLPAEPLKITPSLHGALAAFRSSKTRVYLWADAICINQKDQNGEINHQLQLMGPIYSQAAQVLVWLGQPTDTDSLAFATIHMLSAVAKSHKPIGFVHGADQCQPVLQDFRTTLASCRGIYRCSCCNESYKVGTASPTQAFDALAGVWNKRWFFRIWTCQESVLPKRCIFYCGQFHASREMLTSAAEMHRKLCDSLGKSRWHPSLTSHKEHIRLASNTTGIRGHRQDWLIWSKRRPREFLFSLLLLRAGGSESSDIRDIIYGIRSLTFLAQDHNLDAYSTIGVNELFQKVSVAALLIQSNERLSPALILGMAGTNPTIPPRRKPYPSWAMEIDKFRLDATLKYRYYINESQRHRAGGPCPRMPVFFRSSEPNVCCVQGIFNSKVAHIMAKSEWPCEQYYCGLLTKKTIFTDYVQKKLIPWYIRCRHYALSTRTGHKKLEQSFYQLLVQGRDLEKISVQLGSEIFPLFTKLLNRAITQSRKTSEPLPMIELFLDDVVHDLSPFLTPNMLPIDIDPFRNLGVTKEGRLAWLPELTKVGDEVWLVKGAPFPFVFRDVGKGYKSLIGDAYLHEAQNGEAWPTDEGGLQEIRIV